MNKNIIKKFNEARRNEALEMFNIICKSAIAERVQDLTVYELLWDTGKDMIILDNTGKGSEGNNQDNYLNYYWIEFCLVESDEKRRYKISFFYKDFDSNTGYLHILPGAIQLWLKQDSNSDPIHKNELENGKGIRLYNEYGWEPCFKKPIFPQRNINAVFDFILKSILSYEAKYDDDIFKVTSSNFYKQIIDERKRIIDGQLEKGQKRKNGNYKKYALIMWVEKGEKFIPYHKTVHINGLGYFSKYGEENSKMPEMAVNRWSLDIENYASQSEREK